jgi:1-acylglycerone phosphate reductase
MNNLASLPGITLLQLDVTDISSIQKARDSVLEELSQSNSQPVTHTSTSITSVDHPEEGLDLLINNAGVAAVMPAIDHDIDSTRKLFETNVFGMMMMVQAFTPLLMKSKDACIVNIGSLGGVMPWAFQTSYNATKAAVHAYSDTLRLGESTTHLSTFGLVLTLLTLA